MKQFKRSLRITVSLILVLAMLGGSCVFADDDYTIIVNGQGVECLVDGNGHYHSYYDINGNPLTISEALFLINNELTMSGYMSQPGINQPEYHALEGYTAYVNSTSLFYGSDIKVTPDVEGPGSITYGNSIEVSWGWTGSISAEVKTIVSWLVSVDFGIELNSNASTTTNFSVSFNVPSGSIGAVYFMPKYRTTNITVYDEYNMPMYTICESPEILNNGFADGLYHLVTW